MEAVQLDTGGAPLELTTSLASLSKGLRFVELLQLQGPKSYQPIGLQWSTLLDGEACNEDETPDDSAETIVKTIWLAAQEHHREKKGDQRFAIKLHRMAGGKIRIDDLKFSVSPINESDAPEAPSEIAFSSTIVEYLKALHALGIREREAYVRMIEAGAERDLRITDTMRAVMESAMNLKMDAFEDRAQAILESNGVTKPADLSDQWAGTKSMLESIINSPIGAAFAAKFVGLSPDEMKDLIGSEDPETPAQDGIQDIRPILIELGNSIDKTQQTKIVSAIGIQAGLKLMAAGKAASPESSRVAIMEAFDMIDKSKKWDDLDTILSTKQKKIMEKVFLFLNPE